MRAVTAGWGVARARRTGVLGVLVAVAVPACNDRTISPPIDWPAPVEITRRIDRRNCIVIDGGVKCWAYYPGSDVTSPNFDTTDLLMLMARDELFPGSPLPFVDFGTDAPVLGVSYSGDSRCVALEGAGVKCWGKNENYRLGLPDPEVRIGDDPEERGAGMPFVDLGRDHDIVSMDGRCALFRNGRVKCWGNNGSSGLLGLGDTETRGDDPGEMGDALPFVDLGTDVRAVGLSASCIWTDNGRVKCWGNNDRGQLGVRSDRPPPPPVEDGSGQPDPWGEPLGDEPGEMGDALPFVDLGTDVFVVQAAKALEHTCALTEDGRVKCWGANCEVRQEIASEPERSYCGRLGLEDQEDRVPPLGDGLAYVDLGTNAKAVAIDAYELVTCALLDDGHLKCWGSDAATAIGDEPGEMGDALLPIDVGTGRTVRAFRLGERDICALLDDDSIKCWDRTPDPLAAGGDGLEPQVTREDLYGEP